MALVAEIQNGPQKGLLFQIVEGKTFGRVKADYLLKDDNVSSTHCKVIRDDRGQLSLIDLDSSNGLMVNSQFVKKVLLIPGVSVTVGDTDLRIKEISEQQAQKLFAKKSWRSTLRSFFSQTNSTKKPRVEKLAVFNPVIELEFLTGLQAEQKKILSYGPRSAGFGHLDIEIEEASAPQLAFEIHPQEPAGALFVNKSGFKILLNKTPLEKAQLKEGDLIEIGQSIIKVNFI